MTYLANQKSFAATPKALKPPAQRWAHKRATLGRRVNRCHNPVGVAPNDSFVPRLARFARKPGLNDLTPAA